VKRLGGGYYDGSTGEMRQEDDNDDHQGGAEVMRRRRRRWRPPWQGVCWPELWGGNRSNDLFYYIGQPTQHPPPVSLPSPMQLAFSVVNVQWLLVLLVLVLIAFCCFVKIACCPPCQEHLQHFQRCVSPVGSPIPSACLPREGTVQFNCQIVQGEGGNDTSFVGKEAHALKTFQ